MTVIALIIAGMITPEDAVRISNNLLEDQRIGVACVDFETATAVIHVSADTETSDVIGIIEGMCVGFTARVPH